MEALQCVGLCFGGEGEFFKNLPVHESTPKSILQIVRDIGSPVTEIDHDAFEIGRAFAGEVGGDGKPLGNSGFDQTNPGLETEIESNLAFHPFLQEIHDAESLGVVTKAPLSFHQSLENPFTDMSKGWVSDIVGEGDGFGEVGVETEGEAGRAGELGDFERMGKSGAKMVSDSGGEDLCFLLQSPESCGVKDAIPVPLEACAKRVFVLLDAASPAVPGPAGKTAEGR
jgi:hypothetical protein